MARNRSAVVLSRDLSLLLLLRITQESLRTSVVLPKMRPLSILETVCRTGEISCNGIQSILGG